MTPEDLYRIKNVTDPRVSPDGKWIAYTVSVPDIKANSFNSDIWITPLAEGDSFQLTRSPKSDHSPRWSPDGSHIAFISSRDGVSNIYLMCLKGGEAKKITDSKTNLYSPDGRYIAYAAMEKVGYEADRKGLVVYDRIEGKHTRLTDSLDQSVEQILWSPDSKVLFFTVREEGRRSIYGVDLKGVVNRIFGKGYNGPIDVSPNGRCLVCARSYNFLPNELFAISLKEGTTYQLTSLNAVFLKELELSKLEEFWFTGAENTKVHGFIQKPPGFETGKKYPVVLTIHGGPQNMWADRFTATWFTFQLVCSPGYVGVFINPRGSTGYGSTFREQVSRDYGGRCYQDLMRGM
jgi:dipeptidyl aminopeptidase/acylaminoacyl peptidase